MVRQMTKLIPQQVQAEYLGIFVKPAFVLYGIAEKLWGTLFSIFSPYQVPIVDMRNASTSPNPSDQVITVYFGQRGEFNLRLDRIETKIQNTQDLQALPEILNRTQEWLRSDVPEFSFRTHLFAYGSQNELSGTSSQEFLLGLSNIDIPGIGASEGSGIIFHWDISDRQWRAQLTVDHSLAVPGGLFIQLLVRSEGDSIDYVAAVKDGDELLTDALSKLGLERPIES